MKTAAPAPGETVHQLGRRLMVEHGGSHYSVVTYVPTGWDNLTGPLPPPVTEIHVLVPGEETIKYRVEEQG